MMSLHITVSGRVQGVFFRANIREKAAELGLKGYTKNLNDGNVEVVAEGNEEKIKELIEFIKKGPGIAKVKDIKIKNKEPENFKSFEVRH
ncbi:acylphosphatase [Candidatus Woesearchaeota archaeon]|nr:acylphosphatase [Candidatus Woesearchaeota archaeon]